MPELNDSSRCLQLNPEHDKTLDGPLSLQAIVLRTTWNGFERNTGRQHQEKNEWDAVLTSPASAFDREARRSPVSTLVPSHQV
jgi:hypothetical protein